MRPLNAAQQIIVAVFGLPIQNLFAHQITKMEQATKRGPGRKHKQGDGSRTTEQKKAGAYSRGLRNRITQKQGLAALASRG